MQTRLHIHHMSKCNGGNNSSNDGWNADDLSVIIIIDQLPISRVVCKCELDNEGLNPDDLSVFIIIDQ